MDSHEIVPTDIFYPESDGKPMADNTLQWDWMVKIVGELRELFANENVFVAGDLFWYPVQGQPRTVMAPDAMVVFGRPPGYRGSYKQWEEEGIAPQVVFEVLSPSNTETEMADKLHFYDQHRVEEYYVIDPYAETVEGYLRLEGELLCVEMQQFTSPRLGVRFEMNEYGLKLYLANGREFMTREDRVREFERDQTRMLAERDQERQRLLDAEEELHRERERAEQERERAEEESRRAEQEKQRAERFLAKLRELGVDPDAEGQHG